MNNVFIKTYLESDIPYKRSEMLRYAGVKQTNDLTEELLDGVLKNAGNLFSYRVCFKELSLSRLDDIIDIGFTRMKSNNLGKNLEGCNKIILFAATVGQKIDRLIERYSIVSPSKALMLSAIGSERIEALCDVFNEEIKKAKEKEGYKARPRFSPGYGDLPLSVQKDVFAALECTKNIGISLNDNLIMSPSKSVTAIIGFCKGEIA